jgi:phosphatidate cytidylyltransferase
MNFNNFFTYKNFMEIIKANLFRRILAAVIGIPLIFLAIFSWHGVVLTVLLCLIAFFGMKEYYKIIRGGVRPINPSEPLGYLASTIFIILAAKWPVAIFNETVVWAFAGLVIVALCSEFFYKVQAPLKNTGVTIFGLVYIGYLLSFVALTRSLDGSINISLVPFTVERGAVWALVMFILTWSVDVGGYVVGKTLGGRKKKNLVAGHISPGKTWEGSIGGFFFSVVIALALGFVLKLPLQHLLALGAICGVAGQLGDLSESALKREFGVKDSGDIIPGHGGILDRFDSLLFIAPVFYLYIKLFNL